MSKICTKCRIEKEVSEFYRKETRCISCANYYKKEYYNKNKAKINLKTAKYYQDNKTVIADQSKIYRENNKEKIAERNKIYVNSNKDKVAEKQKIYSEKNKEKKVKNSSEYYLKNKEKFTLYHKLNRDKINQRRRNKINNCPITKTSCILRSRLAHVFNKRRFVRKDTTMQLLGVSYETAKAHIERQFKKGMSWSNHGEWHIDHKIPLSSAKTEEELKVLFHYTNLQPLWAIDNIKKSDKILPTQTILTI